MGREECSVKCEVCEKCEVWNVKCEVWSVECEGFASSLAEKKPLVEGRTRSGQVVFEL